MKKTFIDTLDHIFSTIDEISCGHHCNLSHVDDICNYTQGHYNGPGYIYKIDVVDDDDNHDIYHIVMDNDQRYLGTMAWLDRYFSEGWFNDTDPDWMNKKTSTK